MILAVSGHGAVGILDEALLYGLIVVIIVVIALLLRPRPRSDAADDPANDGEDVQSPFEGPRDD